MLSREPAEDAPGLSRGEDTTGGRNHAPSIRQGKNYTFVETRRNHAI